jgi:hypothetical protein
MKDMVHEGTKFLLNAKYQRLVSISIVKTLLIVETFLSYTLALWKPIHQISFQFQNPNNNDGIPQK